MPIDCPVDLNTAALRSEIASIYGRVAEDPHGEFHFHRGPGYAVEFLGYDAAELASLPSICTASFAGIANPLAIGPIHAGETVLDIGCGAGMDLLLAARRVGPGGRAIGVDMTDSMIERARQSAEAVGLAQVEVRKGDATALPITDATLTWSVPTVSSTSSPKKNAASPKSSGCSSPAASCISPTLPWMSNCRRMPVAISTSGRVESPALCRRQRSFPI